MGTHVTSREAAMWQMACPSRDDAQRFLDSGWEPFAALADRVYFRRPVPATSPDAQEAENEETCNCAAEGAEHGGLPTCANCGWTARVMDHERLIAEGDGCVAEKHPCAHCPSVSDECVTEYVVCHMERVVVALEATGYRVLDDITADTIDSTLRSDADMWDDRGEPIAAGHRHKLADELVPGDDAPGSDEHHAEHEEARRDG